jgi:divalent metal cation (Fe/Co/Zn/Cd) transporter
MTLERERRAALVRTGLRLEYATLGWNAFEGATAVTVGLEARSVALTAYGLDSVLEVFASSVAIWQLKGGSPARERIALRLIGGSFLLVAAWITYESFVSLVDARHAETSTAGIALTAAALVVMLALGRAKLRVGRALDNPVLEAEARFSLVDGALSGTVLIGLALNLAFGWWWADPVVALALAAFSAREGVEGLRGHAV